MTVQDLYDLYARYKKDISDVSDELFWDWADEINRFAYRIMYAHTPDTLISTDTISVVAGTASYALPSDFLNIEPLGTGFFKVNNGNASEEMYFKTGYGSDKTGYYITNGNVVFTPAPQSSFTVSVRYIPELTGITSYSDSLVIPDEFIYYARDAIDAKYVVWDEDYGVEGPTDMRFTRALDELARNLRKDASTVGIQTYSNYFRN